MTVSVSGLPSTSSFPRQTPGETGMPRRILSPARAASGMADDYNVVAGLESLNRECTAGWRRWKPALRPEERGCRFIDHPEEAARGRADGLRGVGLWIAA